MNPLCQTLSKSLEMSRNTLLISRFSSRKSKTSCVIEISWLMQEFQRLKPDRFCEIKLLSVRQIGVLLYIILSNILLQIGNKGTGRYFLTHCLSSF